MAITEGAAVADPAWRIELHFNKSSARMLAYVVRSFRAGTVEYIPIAIRPTADIRADARSSRVRRRLVIAHGHTDPESGMQLEVERSALTVLRGKCGGILGQLQKIG